MAESERESNGSFGGVHDFDRKQKWKRENRKDDQTSRFIIQRGESRKRKSLVNFMIENIFWGLPLDQKTFAAKFHLTYKFVKTECKIVRNILHEHCFKEVHESSSDFNLMWTGSHLKLHSLQALQQFQKVNHFPRSYELTRKDKLYQNIQKMQSSKGYKNFDFIPEAFVSPMEYNQFCASFSKQRGLWIVKPVASSRGRGIFLVNHPSQIPLDDTLLVSRYISNPLLVDGFKFDLRLYVGVTSFDPLRIYLYEEGLTRFATVKYDQSHRNIKNSCIHLTNYSVNKKNHDYVSCNDPHVEDYGNKWSFGALLRFLKAKGIDTSSLVAKIEDLIIKTIICGELAIATACKMFVPHCGNCFEIYGFDVLIDDNLKPWLMEVNLSPSMACDSPMDLKIKSNLLTDMFNLTGFIVHDPLLRKTPSQQNYPLHRQRCRSAGLARTLSTNEKKLTTVDSERGLTTEEIRVLRDTKDEFSRRGHFVRIFPTPTSRERYGAFLEFRTTNNRMLFARLFLHKSAPMITFNDDDKPAMVFTFSQNFDERMKCYLRQLPSLVMSSPKAIVREKMNDESIIQTRQPATSTQNEMKNRHVETVLTHETMINNSDLMNHPVINVNNVIKMAGNLSKLEARKTFATYLRRVKDRLVKEVTFIKEKNGDEDEKKSNEQMSLVIRFLKRAAKNLHHEFRVIVPSHKLPLSDRRRILAQQLGDFVHIYDKETAQMKETSEVNESSSLSSEDFNLFLKHASENELEEVLTLYTKENKNTSIFLGNPPSQTTVSQCKANKPPVPRFLEGKTRLRSQSAHDLSKLSCEEAEKKLFNTRVLSEHNRRLAGAIAAYGKSLNVNKSKRRPTSAVLSDRKQISSALLNRPGSAKHSETMAFEHLAIKQPVSEALKQLARRQAERQYHAKRPLKIETNKWMQQPVENTDHSADSGDNVRCDGVVEESETAPISYLSSRDNANFITNQKTPGHTSTYGDVLQYTVGSCIGNGTLNVDKTYNDVLEKELQISSMPTHFRETFNDISYRKYPTLTQGIPVDRQIFEIDQGCHSKTIRIPCGGDDKSERTSSAMMDRIGSPREEYNKHMQLLIERLAAQKFNKTGDQSVVPKPPSRPRSAKRSMSSHRMARIISSHGSRV